jgi:hypothetical protein
MVQSRSPLKRVLRAVALATVVVLATTAPASATDNLWRKWVPLQGGCYDYYVRFNYQASVPAGAFRDRISNGRSLWNAVNRELYFAQSATNTRVFIAHEQIGWPNENLLAMTVMNYMPPWQNENGTITFTTNVLTGQGWEVVNWYTGSALPVPADKYDLYTVAGHEFGHVVSLFHGTAPDIMRPTISKGQAFRSLSAHDKDGIKFYYAALAC